MGKINNKRRQKFQIRDLSIALKDLEPHVKEPGYLTQGKRFSNFNMLVREAWVNWLLCVVLQESRGEPFTFQETDEGDGIIVNKNKKTGFAVEHVSAMDYPAGKQLPKNEDRVLWAINHKIQKGDNYAKGKALIVFLDGADLWYPNRVARAIPKNSFLQICCVGLLSSKNGYSYSVSEFNPGNSPTFLVNINNNFNDWSVQRVQ